MFIFEQNDDNYSYYMCLYIIIIIVHKIVFLLTISMKSIFNKLIKRKLYYRAYILILKPKSFILYKESKNFLSNAKMD